MWLSGIFPAQQLNAIVTPINNAMLTLITLQVCRNPTTLEAGVRFLAAQGVRLKLLVCFHSRGSTSAGRRWMLMCATDGVWDVMTGQDSRGSKQQVNMPHLPHCGFKICERSCILRWWQPTFELPTIPSLVGDKGVRKMQICANASAEFFWWLVAFFWESCAGCLSSQPSFRPCRTFASLYQPERTLCNCDRRMGRNCKSIWPAFWPAWACLPSFWETPISCNVGNAAWRGPDCFLHSRGVIGGWVLFSKEIYVNAAWELRPYTRPSLVLRNLPRRCNFSVISSAPSSSVGSHVWKTSRISRVVALGCF